MNIYKTTNLINGKIYIGYDTKDRFSINEYAGSGVYFNKALKKYGIENFQKEILEKDIIDFEVLKEREIYWIERYNSKKPNGYNLADGGGGIRGYKFTEEQKLKLSESHKGIKQSQETIERRIAKTTGKKRSDESKDKIRQKLIGNKNSEGHNHTEETKYKQSISKIGAHNPMFGNNYTKEEKDQIRENSPNRIEVCQYDLDGVFICEYKSQKEASIVTDIHMESVRAVCLGRMKQTHGFIFRYKNGIPEEPIKISGGALQKLKNFNKDKTRPVLQYDLDGNFTNEYFSINEAASVNNIHTMQIRRSCENDKPFGGFIWKYKV